MILFRIRHLQFYLAFIVRELRPLVATLVHARSNRNLRPQNGSGRQRAVGGAIVARSGSARICRSHRPNGGMDDGASIASPCRIPSLHRSAQASAGYNRRDVLWKDCLSTWLRPKRSAQPRQRANRHFQPQRAERPERGNKTFLSPSLA